VVFVLATTDPRDIPATVLSRVQRFDFRPIAPDALAQTLERILTEEKIAFEPAALPSVVRAAEGSLRDALSLLDTAIAYGNGRLDAETTATLLGTTTPAEVRAFAGALITHQSTPALEAIDRAAREGEDLQAFTRDVIELLRRALVLKAAPTAKLADISHAEGNELRKLAEAGGLDDILYVLRAFLDADAAMRESPHPRVELEIATVRATRRPVPHALEDVLKRVDEAEARLRQSAVGAPPVARAPEVVRPVEERRAEPPMSSPRTAAVDDRRNDIPASPQRSRPPAAETAAPAERAAQAPVLGEAPETWQRVMEEVTKRKPTLGAILAQTRPGAINDRELTVVLAGNHFHREMLADAANRETLLQAIRKHMAGVERFSVSADDDSAGGVSSHPAVKAAIAQFEGEVVAVRPRLPEGEGQ
jgi:DNA polymerase-3 subunit gamma/tau